MPLVGLGLFLLIGNVKLPKKRRAEQARIDGILRERVAAADGTAVDVSSWPRWFTRVTAQNERLTSLPPLAGNRAELIDD